MNNNRNSRPSKTPYPKDRQKQLREKAIGKIKALFLPDRNIISIKLIGSSIKGDFGEYQPPGFRGSLYSDFDFIFFVKKGYQIPEWLEPEPNGKPFPEDKLNLAYRIKDFIEAMYDAELFFIFEPDFNNPKIRQWGEKAGLPMSSITKNKSITIK